MSPGMKNDTVLYSCAVVVQKCSLVRAGIFALFTLCIWQRVSFGFRFRESLLLFRFVLPYLLRACACAFNFASGREGDGAQEHHGVR